MGMQCNMKRLPKPIAFDWDKANVDKNWIKHEVDYKEAEEIFTNKPIKIFLDLRHAQIEERFLALGVTDRKRKLAIIFTLRNNKIRVISARDQSKKDRDIYEKN